MAFGTFYFYEPGDKLQTGHVLGLGQVNRKMFSLYLSLTETFDVKLDRFGDSDRKLAEI